MHTDTLRRLQHTHAADLRGQAAAHRLADEAKKPRALRVRFGWTLIEVGLRIAATPRPAIA
ncbi:MAG: hypothetical protein LBV60_17325 [Streptomyces sp.]|jgi:hypothetical protein|nr:hypothetical protein [Streptomyces sp.]